MITKNKLLTLMIMIFSTSFSFAQNQEWGGGGKMTPDQRADKAVARLDEKVTLTADQKTKAKQIYLDSFTQEDSYRQQANGDKEKFKELSAGSRKKQSDDINAILTTDQQALWKKAKEDEKAKHQQNKGGYGQ